MAIDLAELVDPLKRQVNPPGGDVFPNATDDEWTGRLSDAFWEIRMLDMFSNYTESDGLVEPISGSTELPRESQQLIILFAAITSITNELKNLNSVFRAKAGPVEFETQQSGTLLKDILAELQRKRVVVEAQLFELGQVTDVYIDSITERDYSMGLGDTWWVN